MQRFIRVAVLFLPLAIACATAQPRIPNPEPRIPNDASLRILTYNIHAGRDASGRDNLERVAAVIASAKADIVLLQEVDRNTERSGKADQLAALMRLSGMNGRFGKSLDYQGGEYGIAILSRWPIVSGEIVPLRVDPPQARAGGSLEPRIALIVTIASPHGPLRIANTHLDASREDQWRMQEIPQVLRAAGESIAGGDFNSTPDSAVHGEVLRAGLRDSWTECGRGDELTYPAEPPQKRIDYVFLDRSSRCTSARVIDTDASDHRPVLVVVQTTSQINRQAQ